MRRSYALIEVAVDVLLASYTMLSWSFWPCFSHSSAMSVSHLLAQQATNSRTPSSYSRLSSIDTLRCLKGTRHLLPLVQHLTPDILSHRAPEQVQPARLAQALAMQAQAQPEAREPLEARPEAPASRGAWRRRPRA